MDWEINFLNWVNQNLHCTVLDATMIVITTLGDAGLIWIVLAVVLLIQKKYRKVGLAVTVALVLELTVCNVFLKPWVARIRPYDVNTTVKLLIGRQLDYSFPSGHTAAAFATVAALWGCKNKLWKPAVVLAALMAFSRLYLYMHYPTDVIAGGVIGAVCGIVSSQFIKQERKAHHL
jgi:undecaprenyl-diphosphatase